MKHTIPTYDMNSISQHGFLVERFEKRSQSADDILMDKGIHRDSYYIFTCLEKGHVKMMVDFNIIEAKKKGIFCVLPGQVHQGLIMDNVSGWFVAVRADFIPDLVRSVFEETLVEIKPLFIDENRFQKLNSCAWLLYDSVTNEILSSKEGFLVIRSFLNAFLGMFSFIYSNEYSCETSNENRALQLSRAFRILVKKEFKTLKSPSGYAEILNISRGYLTEIIRETTGKPAQHWIHQEILIESKRLLVYTHLTVKEIAYELGYSDHTYFSRLFSKLEGQPPSEFRNKNRNTP
jgi:AraC family transcriptional activator of pobA